MSQQDERPHVGEVLYVYRCPACRHRGERRLPDDTHDGQAATCSACGGPVTLEWDAGRGRRRHAGREGAAVSPTFGLTSLTLTKTIAIALASGGLISGRIFGPSAAGRWYWEERTTRVPVVPLDVDPNAIESGEADCANLQWRAAQFRADPEIGRLNTRAARWTAQLNTPAVVLGTLSSVVGLF